MQEDIISTFPGFKLYNDKAIRIGTFIGGPLVAGYLAAENFKQLGQKSDARKAWIIAIITTILIFGGILLVPELEKIPRYIIPLVYTGLAQFLVQKYQGESLKKHIAEGGQLYSAWRAVWIGLIGLVVLVAIIAIILLAVLPDKMVITN
jgi:hypothetical protein